MRLAEEIEKLQKQMFSKLSKQTIETITETTQNLIDKKIETNALKTGDNIIDFKLYTNDKKLVDTERLRNKGPIVISFFRGSWCPFCNLELHALNKIYKDIKRNGAELITLSPDLQKNSDTSKFDFPILIDEHNYVAKKFNLVFQLEDTLKNLYQEFSFNISKLNEDESYELPIPVTYIVDQSGKIIFDYIDPDYTKRAEPYKIIECLNTI